VNVVDLSTYPAGTGEVLAALAAHEARDRPSAVPYTLVAARTNLDRDAVRDRCERLVGDEHVERVEWESADETLVGYFVADLRVREQGRELARESA
jgi:hypothetical protein